VFVSPYLIDGRQGGKKVSSLRHGTKTKKMNNSGSKPSAILNCCKVKAKFYLDTEASMARRFLTLGALLAFAASAPGFSLAAPAPLDYPHSPEYVDDVGSPSPIVCMDCHLPYNTESGYLPPWQNIGIPDDSASNALCWSCHNNLVAPEMPTHSSNMIDEDYGVWRVDCQTCHWVHQQQQFRDYGASAYLASGISTGLTANTLAMTGAGWQVDEFAGMILVPNVTEGFDYYNYRILNNTADTITINGTITGANIGDGFAVIYGKLIDTTIDLSEINITPAKSGAMGVKFPGYGTPNAYADSDADGDGIYTGICEVCHTQTAYHRNNDNPPLVGDPWYNDPNGKPNRTHNVSTPCVDCHKHSNGFMGMGGGAHEVHVTETFGPAINCTGGDFGCHGNSAIPLFADGSDFAATTTCDSCHSADGVSIIKANGATNGYWNKPGSSNSEPDSWGVVDGERSFCGSCHDATPGNSDINGLGADAPNVLGDDATYGFYFTGHGLQSGNYAALAAQEPTESGNPAAAKTCSDCHDTISQHFGGLGGRLKAGFENDQNNSNCNNCHISGGEATNPPDLYDYADFSTYEANAHGGLLCSQCHDVHGRYEDASQVVRPTGLGMIVDENGVRSLCFYCHNATPPDLSPLPPPPVPPLTLSAHLPSGTEPCSGRCHNPHNPAHGHGSTGVGCVECHGHDAGTAYDPDMASPFTPGAAVSQGVGTVQSHSTHTETDADDLKGPAIYCDDCHDITDMPYFRTDIGGNDSNSDGRYTLAETAVCDVCHSPGGDYDGLDDSVVGAKNNWQTGVYETTSTLQEGKEKWCATCHDGSPSVISAVSAPNVIGDEVNPGRYGTGYGYYKSGHGLPSSETYAYSGGLTAGANQTCDACHDFSTAHIDGNARTFDDSDSQATDPSLYRIGYRLKLVYGIYEPMDIPVSGANNISQFWLCYSCHDYGPFLDPNNMDTNFVTQLNATDPFKNRHESHLVMTNQLRWMSDWTDSDIDPLNNNNSQIACVTCHNVHGSDQLAMVRDGKLINAEPGLQMWYGNPDVVSYSTSNPNPPDPEDLPLSASTGTIWRGGTSSNLCSHCHANNNTVYEPRTPAGNISQAPTLDWSGTAGFIGDGVNPNIASGGSLFEFQIEFTDLNNDPPAIIEVWIDKNDNGSYLDPGEVVALSELNSFDTVFVDGKIYTATVVLRKPSLGDGVLNYRFYAEDPGGLQASGPGTAESVVTLLNGVPSLDWTGEQFFTVDGVNPDVGGNGTNFTFRVEYTDPDDEAPSTIQVWVDKDGNGDYLGVGEQLDLTIQGGDGDFTNGEIYSATTPLSYIPATGGVLNYTFRASDGFDGATGAPTSDNTVAVVSSSNTPAFLEWVSDGADCRTDSVKPSKSLATGDVEFRIKYTDPDDGGTGPTSVTVWVDINNNTLYETGEDFAMTLDAGGDSNWTNGEFYSATVNLPNSGVLKYYFEAVDDGGGPAVGGPTTTDKFITVYDTATTIGVRVGVETGPTWYGSIQAAIDAVNGAHTVLVYQGTYNEGLIFDGGNDDDTTVISTCGADLTTINGTTTVAEFQWGNLNSSIDGFQITGGTRGVYMNGTTTSILNSKIWGNTKPAGSSGVGIYSTNDAARLTMDNTEIYSNTAVYDALVTGSGNGAAAFFNGGTHTITNSTVRDNIAGAGGGGIYFQGVDAGTIVSNTTFDNNEAANNGGAIYFNFAVITFSESYITNNRSTGGSGGAWFTNSSSAITVENTVIANNSAPTAGAFFRNGGSISIVNSVIYGNSATTSSGGAMYIQNNAGDPVLIRNSILWNNTAATTGHIAQFNSGFLDIDDSIIQNDGDGDFTDGPHFDGTGTPVIGGYASENDPNFVNEAGLDFHVLSPSDAIDNANAAFAPAVDIDGDSRPQGTGVDIGVDEFASVVGVPNVEPALAWTGDVDFVTDGINPDSGVSTNAFEFRVEYSDFNDDAPQLIQVWIDLNSDGAYDSAERFDMAEIYPSDTVFTDGKDYSLALFLTYGGGGDLNYLFYASDGSLDATGDPTQTSSVFLSNNAPKLYWTGEVNYLSDGVDPDTGLGGANFEFRVDYEDADDSAPNPIQVWVDKDDSGFYGDSEKFDMTVAAGGDGNYANKERFTATLNVPYVADGFVSYRFYASDGVDAATGDPLLGGQISVNASVNNAPVLAWEAAQCRTDGARPAIGTIGSDFEFTVRYTDEDNACPLDSTPGAIQVWIDRNDDGDYDDLGEKINLSEADGGDLDCTSAGGGKLYSTTTQIIPVGDFTLNYRFYAVDGSEVATGAPATGSTVDSIPAFKVKPTGDDVLWFSSIQNAVDAAPDSSTILVWPNNDFTAATYLDNVRALSTVNDLNIKSVCGADLTIVTPADLGQPTVLFQNNSNMVLDGFTLANGATGFYVNQGGPTTIKNSIIHTNNYGIYINTSTNQVYIDNVKIYDYAIRGIHSNGNSNSITNCEIYQNSATEAGGGVYLNGGTHVISDSIIRDNVAGDGAGLCFNQTLPGTTVTNTIIKGNTSTTGLARGGGMYLGAASVDFYKSTITGNSAVGGGGLYLNASSAATFTNCIVADNQADNGGAVMINSGSTVFANVTFANNQALTGDGGVLWTCSGLSNTVSNSIFWNNTAAGTGHNGYKGCGGGVFMDVSYSDISTSAPYIGGGSITTGSGNIDPAVDPSFVGVGDYHIQSSSPVIGQGTATGAPADDIDGDTRPQGFGIDMGADEYLIPNNSPDTPVNSTPTDGATSVSVTPTLTASAFSDPDVGDTHYASQWQVDDNVDFSSPAYDSGAVSDLTSHTLGSGLAGASSYYWRVRYQDNNGGWSSYSSGTSFTTNNPPNAPTNGTPLDGSTGVSKTPTLTASAFSDPDAGDVQTASQWVVDDNADCATPVYDSGAVIDLESHSVGSVLNSAATYYWCVRYQDNHNDWSNYSVSTSFTTLNNAPAQPTNNTPTDTATGVSTTPTLTSGAFSDVDAGDSHANSQWQVDDNIDFSSVTYDSGTVADLTSHTVGVALANSTTYYWRVRHQDNHGAWSSYSVGTSFTTVAPNNPPNTPTNSTPLDGAIDVSKTPTLTASAFSDPDAGDTHAASQWVVDDNVDCATPVYDSGAVADLVSHTVGSVLNSAATYYWCVRYQDNNSGWSNYSVSTSFTTLNNAPSQPTNSTPADAATGVSTTPTLTSGAFSDVDAGDSHANSQWQVDDNIDFSSVAYDSGTVTDLTSHIVASALAGGTTYYWRVRHQDNHGAWSTYSVGTSFTTQAVAGSVYSVCTGQPAPYDKIQTAIADAGTVDGDTLEVCAGVWSENIDFLTKNITVKSVSGAASTTIQGSTTYNTNPVVNFGSALITSGAVLDGFTLNNVQTTGSSRGVYVSGGAAPTIKNCIIENNTADNGTNGGGGVYIDNSQPTFDNVTIRANTALNRNGCGMYITGAAGGAAILNSTIGGSAPTDANTCGTNSGKGGGIYYDVATTGTLSITGSNIQYNHAQNYGAGIYITGVSATTTLTNTTVLNNDISTTATAYGGGIWTDSPLNITGGEVSSNTSSNNYGGGGIYITSTDVVIDGAKINSNTTGSYGGGGIYMIGTAPTLTMSNCFVQGNQTTPAGGDGDGAGINIAAGTATITNCIISGNSTNNAYWSAGGGIHVTAGHLNLNHSTVAGNWANRQGGGVFIQAGATATINGSLMWDNVAADANTFDIEDEGAATVDYSAYASGIGFTGANNVTAVTGTVFATPAVAAYGSPTAGGDFHIKSDAVELVDAGDPASSVTTDIDGDDRTGSINDIGADEYVSTSLIATLHPSGVAQYDTAVDIDDGATFTLVGGTWADVLDTDDGDTSRTNKCCDGGPNNPDTEWMAVNIDDLSALTGAQAPGANPTIVSLKFHVRARYRVTGGPEPGNNVAYTFKVGYTTNTTTPPVGTVPNIDAEHTTSGTGTNYQLFTSITYTTGLTLTDIDNLLIWVRYDKTVNNTLRVTEIYAEVEYIPGN